MVENEKKDIANSVDIYPVIIANPIFRNLHKELIYNVGRFMETKGKDRKLLILGLSPVASPYADNKQWFVEMMGKEGVSISIDYNLKVISKALSYLSEKGFFDEYNPQIFLNSAESESFLLNHIDLSSLHWARRALLEDSIKMQAGRLDPSAVAPGSFLALEGNLNNGINISDNSVDCVEATLTLHHVAAYRQQLKAVLQDIYRVLRPGGMLHYGDAFVDMRGSERKINNLMNELVKITGLDMMLFDSRDPEWMVCAEYSALKNNKSEPGITRVYSRPDTMLPIVEVTSEARIRIPVNGSIDDYVAVLDRLGYKDRKIDEHYIDLPIIDQIVEAQHIHNVIEFEDLVRELKKGLYATTTFDPHLIEEAIKRGDEERGIAISGIVEYFSPKEFIVEILDEIGFEMIHVELPNKDAGYSVEVGAVIAYKPR